MKPEPKFRNLPKHCHHMTWHEFVEMARDGSLIDYDGHGELATATHAAGLGILPSDVTDDLVLPEWATHVVWYNK